MKEGGYENANIIFQSSTTTENEENCQHTNFFPLYTFILLLLLAFFLFLNTATTRWKWLQCMVKCNLPEMRHFPSIATAVHFTSQWTFSGFFTFFLLLILYKMNSFFYFICHFLHVHIYIFKYKYIPLHVPHQIIFVFFILILPINEENGLSNVENFSKFFKL